MIHIIKHKIWQYCNKHRKFYDFDIIHILEDGRKVVDCRIIDAMTYIGAFIDACKIGYYSSPTKRAKIKIHYNGLCDGEI